MEFIKLKLERLIPEPSPGRHDRFTHPAFERKVPKGVMPCDYDRVEKLVEFEFPDGDRRWGELKKFFGLVICEAKDILILSPDGHTESMSIVGYKVYKVKRTLYWNVVFERDLPF